MYIISITPFIPVYHSTCMCTVMDSSVLGACAPWWWTFLALWSFLLLLLSSVPSLLLLSALSSSGQPFIIKIILKERACWKESHYSFIFCPFLFLPFGLKCVSVMCCRMIYGMDLLLSIKLTMCAHQDDCEGWRKSDTRDTSAIWLYVSVHDEHIIFWLEL